MPRRKEPLTPNDVAALLGLTASAIRKRIARNAPNDLIVPFAYDANPGGGRPTWRFRSEVAKVIAAMERRE